MIHNCFSAFPNWKLHLLALSIMCAFSGGTGAETESEAALDSALLNHTRSSLNLSLCAVVFEEEFGDADRVGRYQNGSARAELLIQEGGWAGEEVVRAHDAVLRQDFSFTLSPDVTWSSYRRTRFTKDFCDGVLALVTRQTE